MKVLVVIPYFHDAWEYGGQPRSAFDLCRTLVARGHSLKVLTTDSLGNQRSDSKSDPDVSHIEGIEVWRYRNISNALAFKGRLFWPNAFFKDIDRHVKDADVLHIHELRTFLSVASASSAIRNAVPYALSPHGGLRHFGKHAAKAAFDLLWGRRTLRAADAVVALSPSETADATALGVRRERIVVVPNGVAAADPETFPERGSFRKRFNLPSGKLVLFLGRLHPLKGADLLVDAFSAVFRASQPSPSTKNDSKGQPHLVLAGTDDGQERDLRAQVKRLGVEESVTFTGHLDSTRKLEAFVDSDLVVIPSRSEAFGLVAVEALACSRPVLLSSACGLTPSPGEENGLRIFRQDSPEDLAASLRTAIDDTALREAACRGREFVLREFSLEAAAAKLESVYGKIRNRAESTGEGDKTRRD